MSEAYRAAGVDIDAGNEAVRRIKEHVRRTRRREVIGDIGGFGGLFALKSFDQPVLVSATDGVGTKLKIAFALDRHDTIGIDCVAMCVNDVVVQGAEPLFFSIIWPPESWFPNRRKRWSRGWPTGAWRQAAP